VILSVSLTRIGSAFAARIIGHLVSAWAAHFCFGAPLARLEGHVAFDTILRRTPNLSLEFDLAGWRQNLGFRGLTT
jgi:cytochrome P450